MNRFGGPHNPKLSAINAAITRTAAQMFALLVSSFALRLIRSALGRVLALQATAFIRVLAIDRGSEIFGQVAHFGFDLLSGNAHFRRHVHAAPDQLINRCTPLAHTKLRIFVDARENEGIYELSNIGRHRRIPLG
jgi:hypothetical protein